MGSSAEIGSQLEQRIAAFFRANGYHARCNEVIEGRSGGRHEVDVVAEKSDALTTYRVAIECKAWQQPIEKDVVAKLHYILGDLGLNKGIIVSLAGGRSGAERTAADLGIELWGPDELRRHLGDSALGELTVPPPPSHLTAGVPAPADGLGSGRGPAPITASNTTLAWGYSFTASESQAAATIRSTGKGRMGLRTLERLVEVARIWLPAYVVEITVARPGTTRLRATLRSSTLPNVYEALGGAFLGPVQAPWEQVQADSRASLRFIVRDTKIHAALRKALQDYSKVTAPAAVERHAANLARLGIPASCSSLSIDTTTPVLLPYFVGVLEADRQQRAVAVCGRTGRPADPVSQTLTANLALLRSHLAVDR